MRASLGRARLYGRFAGRIFSAHDVERGKPAPDLFLHAAGQLGHPPGAFVVIEDSPAGIEAARSAGMRSIGYAAETPRHLLVDADIVIDSMVDLTSVIESVSAAESGSGPDTSDS